MQHVFGPQIQMYKKVVNSYLVYITALKKKNAARPTPTTIMGKGRDRERRGFCLSTNEEFSPYYCLAEHMKDRISSRRDFILWQKTMLSKNTTSFLDIFF